MRGIFIGVELIFTYSNSTRQRRRPSLEEHLFVLNKQKSCVTVSFFIFFTFLGLFRGNNWSTLDFVVTNTLVAIENTKRINLFFDGLEASKVLAPNCWLRRETIFIRIVNDASITGLGRIALEPTIHARKKMISSDVSRNRGVRAINVVYFLINRIYSSDTPCDVEANIVMGFRQRGGLIRSFSCVGHVGITRNRIVYNQLIKCLLFLLVKGLWDQYINECTISIHIRPPVEKIWFWNS